MKVSEVGEWGEREGQRARKRKTGKSSLAGKTFERLPRATKGGGREISTLLQA